MNGKMVAANAPLYEVNGCDDLEGTIFAMCTSKEGAQKVIDRMTTDDVWDPDVLYIRKSNLSLNQINLAGQSIDVSGNEPLYQRVPMSVEKQWKLCAEDGTLEGNIIMRFDELMTADQDELLDLMSERLTGSPMMSGISYDVIGLTSSNDIIVHIEGGIFDCDTTEGIEEAYEKLSGSILAGGIDIVKEFVLDTALREEDRKKVQIFADSNAKQDMPDSIKQLVYEIVNGLSVEDAIKYFKKYVVEDFTTEESADAQAYPIVGLQFDPMDYLTSTAMMQMMSLLNSERFETLQIDGHANTSAYVLVAADVYENLNIADIQELEDFVRNIIDDVENETPNDIYKWRDCGVHLSYM